jgi:formylglycine-generating enzyme required for sulfatase activity
MQQVDKLLKVSLKEIRDKRLEKEVEERRLATSDREFTVNGVTFKMIYVEGGTSQMRSDDNDAYDNEKSVQSVKLSSYHIGETPVTQALWKAVMTNNPSKFKGDNLPVETVSWNDCQEFIKKLNWLTGKKFRLPTEAEWEYAARGGKYHSPCKYAGSNNIDEVAWYGKIDGEFRGNSGGKTHSVKAKKSNALNIYDMSGNVWEWCQDRYGKYSGSAQTNPKGPSGGLCRVLRGGSWRSYAKYCRVSRRLDSAPVARFDNYGFRLAM